MLSVPALAFLASVGGLCVRSFLALLLLASPKEVVRDPPYGVRGSAHRVRDPAYRIRDPAHRSPRGYLEEPHLVALHARYRFAHGMRGVLAHLGGRLFAGLKRFLALPEGYPQRLATLPVAEGDHPLKALLLPEPRKDVLPDLAQ